MRKLLLASAAMLSATAGIAMAQNPLQGQLAAPWASGPAPNNNNNTTAAARTGVDATPTPGTVVIRLNGRVETDFGVGFTGADKGINPNGTPNGYKLNPVFLGGYMRLYPGFDGMTTGGLRYGAAIELRQNFPNGTSPAQSSSGNDSAQTVYVRRNFGYVAHEKAGLLRVGKTDGVIGLFDDGRFYGGAWDAGVGNINGAYMGAYSPTAAVVPFYWIAQAGAEYDNDKLVYLTPKFFGFDFGVQYAPGMGTSTNGTSGNGVGLISTATPAATAAGTNIPSGACVQAGPTCQAVTSGNDATRWYNQVAVGGRFNQTFGPVDFSAYGVYETAGKETLTVGATPRSIQFANLSFVSAGLLTTINNVIPGALSFSAAYVGGAVNSGGAIAMRPQGGVNQNALVLGTTYRNGPWTVGGQIGWITSQGAAALTGISQRREATINFGGNYLVAPGFAVVAGYMYNQRHQGAFDFANNAVSATTRDIHGQLFQMSTVFTW